MGRRVVVKLSGQVFGMEQAGSLQEYAEALSSIKGVQPVVVAGGGAVARHYIDHARAWGADEATLDEMGIEASRLNARLLLSALGDGAYPQVPATLSEVRTAADSGLAVVSGGLYPGQSTNGTAALIAEKIGADMFLNATNVDGVYDSDPNKNSGARLFAEIRIADLQNILVNNESVAGGYDLMDIIALKAIQRSSIPTRILRATPDNLRRAILDGGVGTLLLHD